MNKPTQAEVTLPPFAEAWARYEAKGYRYGDDALENVAFGYRIAGEELAARASATPADHWRPIETAPVDTPVRVKLGEGMSIIARLVPDASMTSEEKSCDQWQAEHEGEHPECWTDGACWESNADEALSLQPTAWAPPGTEPRPADREERLLALLREHRSVFVSLAATAVLNEQPSVEAKWDERVSRIDAELKEGRCNDRR